uniref:organic cation transporter protein-like n=1 Tax=Styela clava TaxID=7725 RepID=UPI0019394A96|nr:organic cation transporter protein-like [Styela clava]
MAQVVSMLLMSFSWNYIFFVCCIFVSGVASIMNYVPSFTLMAEMSGIEWRNFLSIGSWFTYSCGYIFAAGFAYFFQTWRWLLRVISIFSLLIYLPSFCLLPESARWLLTKGKRDEANKELMKIGALNNKLCDIQTMLKENPIEIDEEKSTGLWKSLKVMFRKEIRTRCLVACFSWFVACFAYFAIALYSSYFSQNIILNCLFSGLSDFPGLAMAYFLVKYIGRPRSILVSMLISGVSSFSLPFIPSDLHVWKTVAAMFGKLAVCGMFYIVYITTAEIAPTPQRATIMSFASTCDVRGLTAPFLYVCK